MTSNDNATRNQSTNASSGDSGQTHRGPVEPAPDLAMSALYGNRDLPAGTPERPLVTFALFAYNQEKYIRQSVEGALAQTYRPLEIILSDDGSSDRTFEIMQEMAAAYDGPHQVLVRQSAKNFGPVSHVLDVAEVASGEFMVVAAGDDISLPERTERLTPLFSDADVAAGSSDVLTIDETGENIEKDGQRVTNWDRWHVADPTWILGCSAAYRVSFLRALPRSETKLFYEDIIFCDCMKILGYRSFWTKDQFVKYRFHANNLSSRHQKLIDEEENAAITRWQRTVDSKDYCISVISKLKDKLSINTGLDKVFHDQKKYLSLLARWPKLTIIERSRLLWMSYNRGQLRMAIIRVFGYNFFRFVKNAKNRKNGGT